MLNWKRINPAVSRFSKWTKTHMCPFRWYFLKKNIYVYWPPGICFRKQNSARSSVMFFYRTKCSLWWCVMLFTEKNVHSDGVCVCLQKNVHSDGVSCVFYWKMFTLMVCVCVCFLHKKCSLWWCVMFLYWKKCSRWWCVCVCVFSKKRICAGVGTKKQEKKASLTCFDLYFVRCFNRRPRLLFLHWFS